MTQKDKELLFIDLCNRIHYKTICTSKRFDKSILVGMDDDGATFSHVDCLGQTVYELLDIIEFDVKPYLRPMSSMTEEEEKEYTNIDNRSYYCPKDYAHIPASERIDWLNKHHFDYRGLIEKGLALEAPEGMYKKETMKYG